MSTLFLIFFERFFEALRPLSCDSFYIISKGCALVNTFLAFNILTIQGIFDIFNTTAVLSALTLANHRVRVRSTSA
jgi:hypothetical protein